MAQSQIQFNITSVGEGEHTDDTVANTVQYISVGEGAHTDDTVANTVQYYKCRRGRAHR